jgi:hypothetical protein
MTLGRLLAHEGERELAARLFDEVGERLGEHHVGLVVTRVRVAMHFRDEGEIARLVALAYGAGTQLPPSFARFFSFVRQDIDLAEVATIVTATKQHFSNERFRSSIDQLFVEMLAYVGETDRALAVLDEAAAGVLVDIHWLERCNTLAAIRDDPRFARAAALVRARGGRLGALNGRSRTVPGRPRSMRGAWGRR